MKFKSNSSSNSGEFRGFLDQGTELKGDLAFTDLLRADGKISGTITTAGQLIVGESGQIEATINVGTLSVSGTIRGTIVATEKVEIHKTGKVYGDIFTPALHIEVGAIFEGKCQMSKPAQAPNQTKTRSEAETKEPDYLTSGASTSL